VRPPFPVRIGEWVLADAEVGVYEARGCRAIEMREGVRLSKGTETLGIFPGFAEAAQAIPAPRDYRDLIAMARDDQRAAAKRGQAKEPLT